MELMLIGCAIAFNLLVIKFKLERARYEDAFFDAAVLVGLSLLMQGSYSGLVAATIGSAVVSIFLYFSPPTFLNGIKASFEPKPKSWD